MEGQRRHSTTCPALHTAGTEVMHSTGQQSEGPGCRVLQRNLTFSDVILLSTEKWPGESSSHNGILWLGNFPKPQWCLLAQNEPVPCSHFSWAQAEGQREALAALLTALLAGSEQLLCCWTRTHVLELTAQRPSDFEPAYHHVPKANANHPQSHLPRCRDPESHHQQCNLRPPAPQLLSPNKQS